MSVSSIILGCIASIFAVNGAGNLKEAWNKSYDSFEKSSFVSTKAKWGLNLADKLSKTGVFALIAADNFSGNKIKTIALQSVLDVVGGKLPKTGTALTKSISNVSDEAKSNFSMSKPNEETKNSEPVITSIKYELSDTDISSTNVESNTKPFANASDSSLTYQTQSIVADDSIKSGISMNENAILNDRDNIVNVTDNRIQ